jgi:putative transposase
MAVFRSNADRAAYLRLMAQQAERFGLEFLSYCLMDNHVHLVVVPRTEDALARGIGEAHRRYTCWTNARQEVKGYLFQGRFYSSPLDERHLLAAARYAERNPVRAGMAKRAGDYRWSSAAFHLGLRDKDPLVEDRRMLGLIRDWKEMLADEPEEIGTLRKNTRTGRICGDDQFVAHAEEMTGRKLRRAPIGRPRIERPF